MTFLILRRFCEVMLGFGKTGRNEIKH